MTGVGFIRQDRWRTIAKGIAAISFSVFLSQVPATAQNFLSVTVQSSGLATCSCQPLGIRQQREQCSGWDHSAAELRQHNGRLFRFDGRAV